MTTTERLLGVHVPFVSHPCMQEACGPGPQGRGERGARVHQAPVLGLSHTENPPAGASPGGASPHGPAAVPRPPPPPGPGAVGKLTCTDPRKHLSEPGVPFLGEDGIRLFHGLPGFMNASRQVGDGNLFRMKIRPCPTCETQNVTLEGSPPPVSQTLRAGGFTGGGVWGLFC